MGIRFYCPNGHKLNVKAFQAGRQGICPYCGVSVQIPLESTRPSSKELRDQHDYPLSPGPSESPSPGRQASSGTMPKTAEPIGTPFQTPVLPQTPAASPTQTFVAAMPPETAAPAVVSAPMVAMAYAAPQPAASAPSAAAQRTPVSAPQTQPAWPPGLTRAEPLVSAATPAPAVAPTPPALVGDPLTESPGAVWYVRPASGGQFGPATADVMRGWLGEGRVGADTLVWREGWREWQEASATFPQLKPDEATEFFTGLSSGSMAPSATAAGGSHGQPLPSQRRSNASSAVIIIVLVAAVLVLLLVLLMALLQQPKEEKGSGAGSKAAVSFLLPPLLPGGER
jgi:hypothetical protein